MSYIVDSLVELIGNTPLLRLNKYSQQVGAKAELIAKLAVSYTHLTLPTTPYV